MKPPCRQFLHLAAGAVAVPAISRIARAQTYPTRPIRLVVPFPPGGAFDTISRPCAEQMKSPLGTLAVENIGGGGGSVGAAQSVRAQADGYTLLLGGAPQRATHQVRAALWQPANCGDCAQVAAWVLRLSGRWASDRQ